MNKIFGLDKSPLASCPAAGGALVTKRQTFFFVRHAQSRWNASQSNLLGGISKENDHGLSELGARQAELLARKIASSGNSSDPWIGKFCNPNVVFASPLTRAIETAVISLHGILSSRKKDLVLMKEAREKKDYGGKFPPGLSFGNEIKVMVRDDLEFLYTANEQEYEYTEEELRRVEQRREAAQTMLEETNFDISGVSARWWDEAEDEDSFDDRLDDFMYRLRDAEQDVCIVVGHSHFFRAIFREFGKPAVNNAHVKGNELAAKFQETLIPNCAVVGIQVAWLADGPPVFEELVSLFEPTQKDFATLQKEMESGRTKYESDIQDMGCDCIRR